MTRHQRARNRGAPPSMDVGTSAAVTAAIATAAGAPVATSRALLEVSGLTVTFPT